MPSEQTGRVEQDPPSYEMPTAAYQPDIKGDDGNVEGTAPRSGLDKSAAATHIPSLSRRGPVLVLMVTYGLVATWDLLMDFGYLSDPNPLVTTLIFTNIAFDGASVLLTMFGMWAYYRAHLRSMNVYVFSLIGLLFLCVTNLILFIVAPLPQYVLDAIAAARASDVDGIDIPKEDSLKTHQALYMGAGVLVRALYILLVRKYYLSLKKDLASTSPVGGA